MLQPTRTKFRKAHKGRIKGLATSGIDLAFGQFALQALEPERVIARQIEVVLKLKKDRFNLRYKRATGRDENAAGVRELRGDIARIKTIAALKRGGQAEPAGTRKRATKPKRAARSKAKSE